MRLKGDKKVNIYNHKVYFCEEWSAIKGHYDYQISTEGRIINTKTDTILKPYTDNRGDNWNYRVKLNGKTYRVEDLVAQAFLEGYKESDKIRHIDGDKSNNKLRNLYIERVVKDEPVEEVEEINEVWKDSKEVIGKEGYEISDKGRIRNKTTGKFLKTYRSYSNTRKNSNLRVDILDKKYYVHYLVAKAFMKDFNENLRVYHKDKDATNNNIDNLYQIKDKDAPTSKGVIKEFIPINKDDNKIEEVKEENNMEQQNIFGEVEIWKQIEGRNNMYEISDCGRVYSHYVKNYIGYNTIIRGGTIVRAVQFAGGNKEGYKKVDELVLEYFNNNEYQKFINNERAYIRHKNNDLLDNHINNLEVVIPFASDFNDNVIDMNSKDVPKAEPKAEPSGGVSFYIKEEVSFNGKDDTIIKLLELIRNTSIDSAGEIAISREEVDKINNFLS